MKYFPKNKTARCVISIYSIVAVVLWVLYLSSNELDIFNRWIFDFLLGFLNASYLLLIFACLPILWLNSLILLYLCVLGEREFVRILRPGITMVFVSCVYLFFIVQGFLVVFSYPMNQLRMLWNYHPSVLVF